jgi:hypothetical protein
MFDCMSSVLLRDANGLLLVPEGSEPHLVSRAKQYFQDSLPLHASRRILFLRPMTVCFLHFVIYSPGSHPSPGERVHYGLLFVRCCDGHLPCGRWQVRYEDQLSSSHIWSGPEDLPSRSSPQELQLLFSILEPQFSSSLMVSLSLSPPPSPPVPCNFLVRNVSGHGNRSQLLCDLLYRSEIYLSNLSLTPSSPRELC